MSSSRPFEYVNRMYLKEEDFLEDFYETVDAVLPYLGVEWRPNFSCNEKERRRREYLLATCQLDRIAFDSAVVFHARGEFSSLQIHLRSSSRLFIVRVSWLGADMEVEKLLDRMTLKSECG